MSQQEVESQVISSKSHVLKATEANLIKHHTNGNNSKMACHNRNSKSESKSGFRGQIISLILLRPAK